MDEMTKQILKPMKQKPEISIMKKIFSHLRVFMFRGLLAIIPLLLCFVAVQILYVLIDRRVLGFLSGFFEVRKIPGMGILVLLFLLYVIGLVVSNIVGHQALKFLENITERIPLIKTVYSVGKQLSQGLSAVDSEKQAFQKAVLVKLGSDGLMIPGFIMSSMKGRTTEDDYFFVLIPTAPTPASGFVCVVKASAIHDPGWTVEETLKAIVSIGIVTPGRKDPFSEVKG